MIMHVHPALSYQALLSEVTKFFSDGSSSVGMEMKYRYPGFKLGGNTLISICNDDDVGNMIIYSQIVALIGLCKSTYSSLRRCQLNQDRAFMLNSIPREFNSSLS